MKKVTAMICMLTIISIMSITVVSGVEISNVVLTHQLDAGTEIGTSIRFSLDKKYEEVTTNIDEGDSSYACYESEGITKCNIHNTFKGGDTLYVTADGVEASFNVKGYNWANPRFECSDPDGENFYTKATAKGIYSGNPTPVRRGELPSPNEVISDISADYSQLTDFCIDDIQIYEAHCTSNGKVGYRNHYCEGGCVNGACVESAERKVSIRVIDAQTSESISGAAVHLGFSTPERIYYKQIKSDNAVADFENVPEGSLNLEVHLEGYTSQKVELEGEGNILHQVYLEHEGITDLKVVSVDATPVDTTTGLYAARGVVENIGANAAKGFTFRLYVDDVLIEKDEGMASTPTQTMGWTVEKIFSPGWHDIHAEIYPLGDDASQANNKLTSRFFVDEYGLTDEEIVRVSEHVLGNEDAPITIIEYSDFECPYCKRFYSQTLPQIESEYIDSGKVKLVYRHFPLEFHTNAHKAAQASECAADQGEFWRFHNELFETTDLTDLNNIARDTSLDLEKFTRCMENGKYKDKVNADIKEGKRKGVKGTPTFFVNGEAIRGSQTYERFKEIIHKHLNDPIKSVDTKVKKQPIEDDKKDTEASAETVEEKVPTCDDGIWNDGEEGIDCGGPCPKECPITTCNGCIKGDVCLEFGTRIVDTEPLYCSFEGKEFIPQNKEGKTCQNSYECLSNQCSNGICVDLQKELKETRGMLEKIMAFFSSLFS